jgi:DNA-formamidopyrimidine glycosylase
MPEGHTLHRLAREQTATFGGRIVHATSPQGRFSEGAARMDGRVMTGATAYGKHLFQHYEAMADVLHVHLGLYGKFITAATPAPPPRGALRLRLSTDDAYADLRGATVCELLDPPGVQRVLARLGPDPLARRPNGASAYARIRRSKTPLALALMDQTVVAGVGNVYRAELLFRHRRDPYRPARDLDEAGWAAMWSDLVTLMRAGVRTGRIVTTLPEHRSRRSGQARDEDAQYVYRRTGLPCRVDGTAIQTAELGGRNLFWCPTCQVR